MTVLRALLVAACLALAVAGCGSRPGGTVSPPVGGGAYAGVSGAGTSRQTLVNGGLTRSFLLHVPPRVADRPALVVALHGRFGTGAGMQWLTGFDQLADRDGFLVAYPDGVGRGWADGRGTTGADRRGIDDVAFLSALIDAVVHDHQVDPHRVFVAGISNGAFMAERFACDASTKVAAILADEGTLGTNVMCHPSVAVSVMQIAGDSDPIVPFTGGTVGWSSATVLAAGDIAAVWRQADRCPGTPDHRALPPTGDGTTVDVDAYQRCAGGTEVAFYSVTGGGHTWPGGPQYLPVGAIGRTTHAFSATADGWAFFAAHPR